MTDTTRQAGATAGREEDREPIGVIRWQVGSKVSEWHVISDDSRNLREIVAMCGRSAPKRATCISAAYELLGNLSGSVSCDRCRAALAKARGVTE